MNSVQSFFEIKFKENMSDWESTLLKELKITDLGNKIKKEMINGHHWPTLSINRISQIHVTPELNWKKASTTYINIFNDIDSQLIEDLNAGVRNYFFLGNELDENKWKKIESILSRFHTPSEIEVFIMGQHKFSSQSFKVINSIITGFESHAAGGDAIHELALIAKKIIESNETEIFIGVYVDSAFFQNIAKIRAIRLITSKILEHSGREVCVRVVALTSFEGWTLFERYSNILRNETSVASAYIAGADHIQSTGYNALFELESQVDSSDEHSLRSRRMARNTTHILALESMLGVVQDAAFGSYHLENLTNYLCEESWKVMQRMLSGEDVSHEISKAKDKKLQMIKTRKKVLSGINDYPDANEVLGIELKKTNFFRPSRVFEELRLHMEKVKKPKVFIALFGDYAGLNARLNFVKNYFELLGLEVIDRGSSEFDFEKFKKDLTLRDEEIMVLCASDEHYPMIKEAVPLINTKNRFLAGKYEVDSCKNLFVGQNIFENLQEIVKTFGGMK